MICLALGTLLAAPLAADAALRDFRVGVVGTAGTGALELPRMREARVRTLRIPFNWSGIETSRRTGRSCATATYGGFGRYDAIVSEAGRHGIKVLPVLFGAPEYVQGGDYTNMPRTGTRDMGDYLCYVRAVVNHYGRGGDFPRVNGPAQPITEFQAWNEPNLPSYAAGKKVSPAEYGRFLKQTTSAVRAIDQAATIVLAGMPERVSRGMNAEKYLRRLYAVRRIESRFDVVALHPYAEGPRGVKGALIRMRDMLRDVGDRRQVLWLTEIGYASHGPKGHFLVNNEQGQARKLTDTLQLLRRNHTRYKVGTVHWYSWRDAARYSENDRPWFAYAGLYREDGSPKPACNAFARFTGGVRPCRSIPAPPPEAAALNEQGVQSILPSPPPGE